MSQQVIHEISPTQHRLIIIKEGVPTHSPWKEFHQVGHFGPFYFHAGVLGDIPAVFRATPVSYEAIY